MNNKPPFAVFIVIGSVLSLVGFLMLEIMLFEPWQKIRDSQNWQSISCLIESSKAQVQDSDNGQKTYLINISYSYVLNNQRYQSQQVSFFDQDEGISCNNRSLIQQFPEKSQQKCYVNPKLSTDTVLIRDWSLEDGSVWVAICFFGVFLFGGLSMILTGIVNCIIIMTRSTKSPFYSRFEKKSHIVYLTFMIDCIYMTLLLFYLSVVMTEGFNNSLGISYGLGIFLISFTALATVMTHKAYLILKACFEAAVKLELTSNTWPSPSTQKIEWELPDCYEIKKISLHLVCIEKATYSVGSNSTTEEMEVRSIVIQSELPLNTNRGSCEFQVPAKLIPNFQIRYNEVLWAVKCTIKKEQENYSDLYPITIVRGESS